MFGERYFAARQRLAALAAGIGSFGSRAGCDVAADLPTPGETGTLGPPFVLAACGETNAGKSSFLNALAGTGICPVSRLPETTRLTVYRHAAAARDTTGDGGLVREVFRPLAVLRDVTLVDSPGFPPPGSDAAKAADALYRSADVLFVILPFSNPWGAAAWNFMSRLDPGKLVRTILVVQQADRAAPADLPVIHGHLKDLAVKRLGRELPVFPVSALTGSGFAELENHLSHTLADGGARRALLAGWRDQELAALRKIEDKLDWQARRLREYAGFLETVETEVGGLRDHFIRRLPAHLGRVAEVFQLEAVEVARFLSKRSGALRSLYRVFTGDNVGDVVEKVFVDRLGGAVDAVAASDGDEVLSVCLDHRAGLSRRVHEAMGITLDEDPGSGEKLAAARERFARRVGGAAREGIGNLKVRGRLAKDVVRRNNALKSFVFVSLALATAAGVCGALAVPWVPFGLLALAGVFLLGGVVVAWLSRRMMVDSFRERLLDTCGGFANTLRADYDDALRAVFQEYSDTLQPLRRQLVDARAEHEPLQRRWTELFLTLKAAEQETF